MSEDEIYKCLTNILSTTSEQNIFITKDKHILMKSERTRKEPLPTLIKLALVGGI